MQFRWYFSWYGVLCIIRGRGLYEARKANTLTRSFLRDFSASRLDTFFESRGLARDAVGLFSLLSSGCKFLESRRSSQSAAGSLGVYPHVAPGSVPVDPCDLLGDLSVQSVPGMSSDVALDSQSPLDLGVAVMKKSLELLAQSLDSPSSSSRKFSLGQESTS